MNLKVSKVKKIEGEIFLPGDKSISHRAAILGSIAKGVTTVSNFLTTGDCLSTLRCLSSLGVRIEGVGSNILKIYGHGLYSLKEPTDILDAGNSATTMRLLTGLLAGQPFFSVITGDESLRNRPMGRVTKPLRKMGARIWGREDAERAPLAIYGRTLLGTTYLSPIPSAQVKSALLLAGLMAEGQTTVKEPYLSRDHTERMLKLMGAKISVSENTVTVTGQVEIKGSRIDIPGDISSAAFLIVATLIIPDSYLLLKGVGVSSTRTGFIDVLRKMGAEIIYQNITVRSNEPRADILVRSSKLKGTVIEGEIIPRLIDEIPVLAVAATQAEGKTVFKDIGELRVKETDRIKAITTELTKLGAQIEEGKDGFCVKGPTSLRGAECESYGDHRMAMALAVAGLAAEGTTVIRDAECIEISFPGFEKVLKDVAR